MKAGSRVTRPTAAEEAAYAAAERLKAKIFKRTGLAPSELVCPREQSFMTPCVARDGRLAVSFPIGGKGSCVGCRIGVFVLLEQEQAKGAA